MRHLRLAVLALVLAACGRGCDGFDEDVAWVLAESHDPAGTDALIEVQGSGESLGRLDETSSGDGSIGTFSLSEQAAAVALFVELDSERTMKGWSFDEAANAVVFEAGTAPAAGVVVEVSYEPAGC